MASGWDGIRRWAPSKGAATPEGNEGELDTEDSPHLTSETEDGKRRVDGISPGEDITGLEDADGKLLEEADDARAADPGRSGDGGSIGGASEGDPAAGPSGLEVAFGALVGEAGERLSSALGGMLQVGQAAVMDPGSLTLPGQMLRQGAGAAPGLVVEAVQRAVESTPAVTFFGPMAEAPSRAAALLLAEGSTTEGLVSGDPGEAAASAELVMDVAHPTLEAGLNLLGVYGMRAVAPKPGAAPVRGATGGGSLAGSGPAKGFIELSDRVKSSAAVRNFSGKNPVDFVYDPRSRTFVMGNNPAGHDGAAMAAGLPRDQGLVGGRISRDPGGGLVTTEWSGHYGMNWTDDIRADFSAFMAEHGVEFTHVPWVR